MWRMPDAQVDCKVQGRCSLVLHARGPGWCDACRVPELAVRAQLQLMTSWALVGDVWFLEPQKRLEGESAIDFAARVQAMIAARAKLEIVPWDG